MGGIANRQARSKINQLAYHELNPNRVSRFATLRIWSQNITVFPNGTT